MKATMCFSMEKKEKEGQKTFSPDSKFGAVFPKASLDDCQIERFASVMKE